MAKLKMSAEAFQPPVAAEEGIYFLSLKGFYPKASKSGQTINLNPALRIKESANGVPLADGIEGTPVYENLSWGENTGRIIEAFHHSAGIPMDEDQQTGEKSFVGDFPGINEAMNNPNLWAKVKYAGPLLERLFKVELIKVAKQTEDPNQKGNYINATTPDGKPIYTNRVKQWLCQLPDCPEQHPTNLVR